MSLSQLVLDAIDRLKQYNLGIYNAVSNRFGLSGIGGMNANWSRHSKDIATACEAVGTLADAASASQTAAAGSATSAASSATAAHASEVAAAGSATAAAGSATAASGSATAAAGSASTASTKAGEAAASTTAAAGSASTATTKAGEAAGSATAAAGSATAANNSKVAAATSEGNAAASATAAAGSATAAATDRTTVLAQVALAQSAQTASAASAVLAQQYVGTATNVIVPAINYRLASAWDANGQPTAYTLAGVVAVHRYDTRLDWDRGAWRKGKLARASSWYNESLNTATRGAKREFPAVALVVTCTTRVIIYDLHDLDGNGSPRMWMVFLMDGSRGYRGSGNGNSSAVMRGGYLVIGDNNASFGGLYLHDFTRDRSWMYDQSNLVRFPDPIASRNVGYSSLPAISGGIASRAVAGVDLRVLPGAPLDPVSRLPIPTVAVATAAGTSVIHPTGLIANVSTIGGHARALLTSNELWMYRRTVDDGRGILYRMPIPYSSGLSPAWTYQPAAGNNMLVATAAHTPAFARWSDGWARGGDTGLTIVADDQANPANSMYANATNAYTTGWMPGDTRQCAITEGAGSNGASGGELVTNGGFTSDLSNWTVGSSNWSWVGGAAKAGGGTGTLSQTLAVTLGVQHAVTFTISGATAGSVGVAFSGDGYTRTGLGNGTYTVPMTPVSSGVLVFGPTAGFDGSIDNVSCRKAGTFSDAVTGTGELIVNGDGSTTTGWTGGNAGTLSSVSGRLRVTGAGTDQACAYQTIQTKVGETYQIKMDAVLGTAVAWGMIVYAGTGLGGAGLFSTGYVYAGVTGGIYSFVATSATTTLAFLQGGTTVGQYTDFDNLSCKSCIPDRSYKGKGLIPVGTLNRSPVATGSDLNWLSGFATSAYAMQPYNADYDFGTGDCFFSFWMMNGNNGGDFFDRYSGSGARVRALVASGKLNFILSDGANSVSLISTTDVAGASTAGSVRKVDLILRRATQTAEIWIGGVLEASASTSALGSLTNTAATLTLGNTYALNNPLSLGSLCLFRAGAYAPTPNQIRRMYADEAVLFQAGAKAFLGGSSNSVQGLALDEDAGVLTVGTADGVSQFAGLRRIGRLTQAAGTAFTVASVISVAAGGGALLVGTASEAGVVTELMPVKDELRQATAASPDVVFDCITTDATLTNAGRLFVAEGESLLIDALVEATEYGQTPVEGASFRIAARVRRNLGGNIVLVGSSLRDVVDRTTNTLDANISVDTATQTVLFTATGKAGTRLNWRIVPRLVWLGETRTAA